MTTGNNFNLMQFLQGLQGAQQTPGQQQAPGQASGMGTDFGSQLMANYMRGQQQNRQAAQNMQADGMTPDPSQNQGLGSALSKTTGDNMQDAQNGLQAMQSCCSN